MKKVYNDNSDKFADWTTKKLKSYALSYYDSIYGVNACYGCSDSRMLDGLLGELDNRGVEISNQLMFN